MTDTYCSFSHWLGPSFLDDGIDDLGDYESFSTNLGRREVGFDDYIHPGIHWKQDLNFEGWDLNKKRCDITIKFDFLIETAS